MFYVKISKEINLNVDNLNIFINKVFSVWLKNIYHSVFVF